MRRRTPKRAQELEKVDGAEDVDPGVEERLRHRAADVDLCRLMEDDLRTGLLHDRGQLIVDVRLDEGCVLRNLGAPSAGEVVEDGHGIAAAHQSLSEMGADESGAPGDEDSHPGGEGGGPSRPSAVAAVPALGSALTMWSSHGSAPVASPPPAGSAAVPGGGEGRRR